MAVSIPLWLESIPWLFRKRNLTEESSVCTPALIQLTADLACTDDIQLSIEQALTRLQRYINFHLNADIYFIGLPSVQNNSLLHSSHIKPPHGLAGQLRFQLTEHQVIDADELRYKLPGTALSVYAQQLSYSNDQAPAWMVLCFKYHLPGNHEIKKITSPICEALSAGLTGWSRQQDRINAAICSEKAAHAAELHDSMAQILGYMRIKASRLADQCRRESVPELAEISDDLSHQAQCAYRQTRELIACSRLSIEQGQLVEAISQAVSEFEQRSAIVFELDNRVGNQIITEDDTQAVFIVREALNNIVRHSHATHARVQLQHIKGAGIRIRIEDNGKGIEGGISRQDSFGLKIMQERAAKLHANLFILPRQQGGTRIDLQITEKNQ